MQLTSTGLCATIHIQTMSATKAELLAKVDQVERTYNVMRRQLLAKIGEVENKYVCPELALCEEIEKCRKTVEDINSLLAELRVRLGNLD